MNFSQAREIVKCHPKRIGSFTRTKLPLGSIRSASVINFVRYDFNSCTGQTWRYGYSLGDGRVYGHKIVKAASGVWIDSPDCKVVCDETPLNDGEDFTLDLSQPSAKNTTPGRTGVKVSHA